VPETAVSGPLRAVLIFDALDEASLSLARGGGRRERGPASS
jgi:hypothetical protein